MPNVLLTQRCVRSCPYCFAKKHMGSAIPDDIIAWEDIVYIADLLIESGNRSISLLGGEPTLHPDFSEIVLYLNARGLHTHVFTSGIMSESTFATVKAKLGKLPKTLLTWVCNVNDPSQSPQSELRLVRRFLSDFSTQASLGFNIYAPDFDLRFLIDYINAFGLERHIRLGLAHPIPGEMNQYLRKEDLPRMAQKIMDVLPDMRRFKIEPGFDCGFPYCMFNDEQIGKLYAVMRERLRFSCGPAIDISPDMSVWSCFPLSNVSKRSLYEFNSIHEVHEHYEDMGRRIRMEASGLFEECDTCPHREQGLCSGGCLAHMLSGFRDEARVRPEFMPA
jgi:radical SAM protein with 4Fe4S-binding SPASM domain